MNTMAGIIEKKTKGKSGIHNPALKSDCVCFRRTSSDRSSSSRLTSTVKPLLDHSAEAVIDIKPDLEDDDLITNDTRVTVPGKPRPLSSRSSNRGSGRAEGCYRSPEVMRGHERSSSIYGRGYREEPSKVRISTHIIIT